MPKNTIKALNILTGKTISSSFKNREFDDGVVVINRIPPFQRNYTAPKKWGIGLLVGILGSAKEISLQNIVVKEHKKEGDKLVRDIVDGQQRLVTMLIIFFAVLVNLKGEFLNSPIVGEAEDTCAKMVKNFKCVGSNIPSVFDAARKCKIENGKLNYAVTLQDSIEKEMFEALTMFVHNFGRNSKALWLALDKVTVTVTELLPDENASEYYKLLNGKRNNFQLEDLVKLDLTHDDYRDEVASEKRAKKYEHMAGQFVKPKKSGRISDLSSFYGCMISINAEKHVPKVSFSNTEQIYEVLPEGFKKTGKNEEEMIALYEEHIEFFEAVHSHRYTDLPVSLRQEYESSIKLSSRGQQGSTLENILVKMAHWNVHNPNVATTYKVKEACKALNHYYIGHSIMFKGLSDNFSPILDNFLLNSKNLEEMLLLEDRYEMYNFLEEKVGKNQNRHEDNMRFFMEDLASMKNPNSTVKPFLEFAIVKNEAIQNYFADVEKQEERFVLLTHNKNYVDSFVKEIIENF